MSAPAIRFYDQAETESDFLAEVRRGLARRPRAIPPKFFYDRRGSALFAAICELPEYYLTRTEMRILRDCAGEIARRAAKNAVLVELGSGASEKVRLLLDALAPRAYLAIDISRDYLREATERLARDYPRLAVHAACADFTRPLTLSYPPSSAERLVFFPGSSIGNFDRDESETLLRRLRPFVGRDGGFVIGVDLKKDRALLRAAYNDAQGVTARFNLNLLARMRRELGADLDMSGFEHEAVYDETAGRIDMYLVSRRAQTISLKGERYEFSAGERLHTESSYKYTVEEFQALAARAGYVPEAVWTDPARLFSVHFLRAQ
ncbi:methyltransferase [Sulfurifustis variabilis]|uniref:Methyltransferase n=1 Tax=Sulfurifustis variabilis TaxID=1675686 RepID=A0A1B4V0Y4_9GAMM|nr:L-histidine N(alpha)-methyltransferase [Sulfurifustis variabilis]BAU47120.1 methyltransferase [Sulfurifustis variabilis]